MNPSNAKFRDLSLFLLSLVAVFIGFEWRLGKVHDEYLQKKMALEKRSSEIEVLILGASGPYFGFDPTQFATPTFNLSFTSESIFYTAALGKKYLDKLPKLKAIILSPAYFSLENRTSKTEEFWRASFYFSRFGLPSDGGPFEWLDLRTYSQFFRLGPVNALSNLIHPAQLRDERLRDSGWLATSMMPLETNIEGSAKEFIEIRKNTNSPSYIRRNLRALESLVAAAKSRGIEVVFVALPVRQELKNTLGEEHWNHSFRPIKNLTQKYNLPYFDYSSEPRFQPRHLYHDAEHLGAEGAKVFSAAFYEEALKPLLEKHSRLPQTARK